MAETRGRTFPSYQDWARSNRGAWWVYLIGAATILVAWTIGSIILVAGAMTSAGSDSSDLDFGSAWSTNFVLLVTFIPFFFATPLVVQFLHGRPWQTIITPFRKIRLSMIGLGALVWGGLLAVSVAISLPLTDVRPTWAFEPGPFTANLIIVLIVLGFQTSAEEMFFRGYLASWISLRLKNVWLQSLIIGVLFMLPHLGNPEVADLDGLTFLLAASTYFAVGFSWMFVARMTGSIEIALGAHFINNFLVTIVIGSDGGTLGGGSLWTSDAGFTALDAVSTWLVCLLFVAICFRMRGTGDVRPVMAPHRKAPVVKRLPPPGWYFDPWRTAVYRYWDGNHWTPWCSIPLHTNYQVDQPSGSRFSGANL